jgi:hypothetical protein
MQTMKYVNNLKDNLHAINCCLQKKSPLVCIRMHPLEPIYINELVNAFYNSGSRYLL